MSAQNYITRAELKATLQIKGEASNADLDLAIEAASRMADEYNGARYYPTAETRYYTPSDSMVLDIDDISTVVEVAVDRVGNQTYSETWNAGTQFLLEPVNNPLNDKPVRTIVRIPRVCLPFPPGPQSVRVTGTFGWATTPALVKQAVGIQASRLYNRRNAPFGILAVGADTGAAMRLPKVDQDVAELLDAVDAQPPLLGI